VRLLTAADFAVAGRKRIDPIVWDFVEGGAGSEITLEANRRMFDNLEIEPRALVDVSTCDTKSRIFDATLPTPIGIAPTAYHRMVWDEGEIATAQGANGALFIVSIFASCTLEDIAHHATGPLWLQLYWLQQREVLSELVKRASTAGYQAIVLTVDAPRIVVQFVSGKQTWLLPPSVAFDEALVPRTQLRGDRAAWQGVVGAGAGVHRADPAGIVQSARLRPERAFGAVRGCRQGCALHLPN